MKGNPHERRRRSGIPLRRIQDRPIPLVALGLTLAPAYVLAQGIGSDPPGPTATSYAWPALLAVLAVIALNALFVAAETAIELLRPSLVRAADKDDRAAARLAELHDGKPQFVAVCTMGRQTMHAWMIALCFVPAPALAQWMSATWGVADGIGGWLLAGVLLTIPVAAVNLVFGELIPKSYAALHPAGVARRVYRFVKLFASIFTPLAKLLMAVASLVTRRFGGRATFSAPMAEEEIKNLADTAEEAGEIEVEEKKLLHSVFEFTDTVAREVMTPRVDIDAVPVDCDPAGVIELIERSGHSRIPVYEDTDDQIVGIVHAKDLLMAQLERKAPVELRSLMRPALFVPENKNLHELLREMRLSRSQMAIVQDEFGGTAGIVTIEDIVEELVGDIVDEYDVEEPEIVANGTGFLIGGKLNLYDLNEEVGTKFQSDEFDTVGGYVFGLFGRQPKKGEWICDDGYKFTVEETDGRRIVRLHLEPLPEDQLLPDEALA